MSLFQSLLRRIPEPSLRLLVVLAVFAEIIVMSFAMLSDSGHEDAVHHI